jgi:hypothetical protein
MFLMRRLVSRSSRSLAVMLSAAAAARGRDRDDLRGRSCGRMPEAPPVTQSRSPQSPN